MQQWQVTQGSTVEIVNGERSLDAVSAFHALHPNAGSHVYAKPLNGTMTRLGDLHATMDMVLAQAARPRKPQQPAPREVPEHDVQVASVKASHPAKVKAARTTKTAPVVQPEPVVEMVAPTPVSSAVPAASTSVVVAAPRKGGVIGSMLALLADGNKRTRTELYDALAAEFPDRASAEGGMRVTVGVQLVALVKKGHNIMSDGAGKDRAYYIA
jgi:hypothetical protein